MIILTGYIDRGYKKELTPKTYNDINYIMKNNNLHILTNHKEPIEGIKVTYNPIDYPRYVWSFVDKIFYTFKLSYEYDTDVLWVDFNKFGKYKGYIRMGYGNVTDLKYDSLWNFTSMAPICHNNKEWQPIKEFLIKNGYECSDVHPVLEEIFYIPKGVATPEILTEIELFKSVLEYASFIGDYPYKTIDGYRHIGNGEGVILRYIIEKFNIPHSRF